MDDTTMQRLAATVERALAERFGATLRDAMRQALESAARVANEGALEVQREADARHQAAKRDDFRRNIAAGCMVERVRAACESRPNMSSADIADRAVDDADALLAALAKEQT